MERIPHNTYCCIYICRNVIVQLFVFARESTRLDRLEAHAWLRGCVAEMALHRWGLFHRTQDLHNNLNGQLRVVNCSPTHTGPKLYLASNGAVFCFGFIFRLLIEQVVNPDRHSYGITP